MIFKKIENFHKKTKPAFLCIMKYILAFIENHLNQQKVDILRISNW